MADKPGLAIRTAAISIIWGFATGMLAICIPLVSITNSGPILPITVVAGAIIGTFVVWYNPDNQIRNSPRLTNNEKQLEQRVANLEVICSNQELDLQNTINQLELKK